MAYITAQETAQIRKSLKATFPQFKFKVNMSSGHHGVNVIILAGPTDFSDILLFDGKKVNNVNINEFHLYHYKQHEPFLKQVVDIIKTASDNKWYDRSDSMTDYFDTAFYIHLSIGDWQSDYICKK